MRADHPLASRLIVTFAEVRAYPVLTQAGPLPRGTDDDEAFQSFKASLGPKLVSNSIQMLKVALLLDMGLAFYTRLGFLQEIERGELVWRPLDSPVINLLRIGLVVPAVRAMSAPATQLARRLTEDLQRFAAV